MEMLKESNNIILHVRLWGLDAYLHSYVREPSADDQTLYLSIFTHLPTFLSHNQILKCQYFRCSNQIMIAMIRVMLLCENNWKSSFFQLIENKRLHKNIKHEKFIKLFDPPTISLCWSSFKIWPCKVNSKIFIMIMTV